MARNAVRKLLGFVVVVVSIVGCSASSDGSHGGAHVGGTAGSGVVAGAAGGGSAGISSSAGTGSSTAGSGGSAGTAVTNDDGGVPNGPINIDQCGAGNPANLSDTDTQALLKGGAPGTMSYLYPYDGTVFPRGIIAPLLMWKDSDDASAVYVHVTSKSFEYKGCLPPTAAGQLQMPADVWSKAEAKTEGSSDPFKIELSTLANGVVKGPIQETVIIAKANLKGSIFYNSYASNLSPGSGSVFRIVPGKDVELFVPGASAGCNGCHAVSADGTRLVADIVVMNQTKVFKIEPTTMPNPPALFTASTSDGFVGLTPTGDAYLSTFAGGGVGVRAGASAMATLRVTDTGVTIPNTGIPTTAMMPTFSSDGSLLAFNDQAMAGAKSLGIMDYDATAHTAKNYRTVYTEASADKLPSWPFVLPDDKAVVFELGTATDFSGGNVGIDASVGFGFGGLFGGTGGTGTPTVGPWGNLFIVDIAAGKPLMLAKAMGYATPEDAAAGKSYLPYATDEKDMAYYPTVSPVAAGGYFWVFFDSERHYGNKGLHRQLWGTAVTIAADGSYTADPSHPAFYLTGQEFGTGNHRAFTALDPCKAEGETCQTGIDCCGGFCFIPEGTGDVPTATVGTCKKPDEKRCSKTDEACKTQADCCNTSDSCIAGFCGQIIPD